MHASSSVGTCIILSYTKITVYLLKRQGNALYKAHLGRLESQKWHNGLHYLV